MVIDNSIATEITSLAGYLGNLDSYMPTRKVGLLWISFERPVRGLSTYDKAVRLRDALYIAHGRMKKQYCDSINQRFQDVERHIQCLIHDYKLFVDDPMDNKPMTHGEYDQCMLGPIESLDLHGITIRDTEFYRTHYINFITMIQGEWEDLPVKQWSILTDRVLKVRARYSIWHPFSVELLRSLQVEAPESFWQFFAELAHARDELEKMYKVAKKLTDQVGEQVEALSNYLKDQGREIKWAGIVNQVHEDLVVTSAQDLVKVVEIHERIGQALTQIGAEISLCLEGVRT